MHISNVLKANKMTKLFIFVNNILKWHQFRALATHYAYKESLFNPKLSSVKFYNQVNSTHNASQKLIVPVVPIPNEEEDQQKKKESAQRAMKYTFLAFGVAFTGLGAYLVYELGSPKTDSEGNVIVDEYSQYSPMKEYFLRTIGELNYFKKLIREPSREKLLPDPLTYPYYQPPYTLVLELTDVLVHPEWTHKTGWYFKKRPGINQFLESLNGVYEIVVYTAEQGMTAYQIIEALDPNNIIAYRLFRDCTHFIDGHHVKSLDRLNRDLSKVIVVDWNADSVKLHKENMLNIPRWSGNDEDTSLIDLAAFLQTVATSEVKDVREVLTHYSQFDDPLKTFRERQRKLMEEIEAKKQSSKDKDVPLVSRWVPTLLRKNV